jgi:hypothetical protein
MDANCGIWRFAWRLFVASIATASVSMLWSPSAFAQLGSVSRPSDGTLGAVTNTVSQSLAPVVQTATAPVTQIATPAAQTAAPVIQTGSAPASVAQVAAPLAETVAPVVQPATAPVTRTAAPVVRAASPVVKTVAAHVTQVTAPVVKTVAPVVQGVSSPVVQATAPLLAVTAPLVEPLTAKVLEVALPLLAGKEQALVGVERLVRQLESASAAAIGETSAPLVAEPPATTYATDGGAARAGVSLGLGPLTADAVLWPEGRSAWSLALPTMQARPGFPSSAGTSRADAPKATFPSGPTSPISPAGSGSVAAVFSGGGAAIFVAALVAALLLAVPGSSRRLRLELAPWPLPTPLPSLERPG